MATEKPINENKLLHDACCHLRNIETCQNEIFSCNDKSGFAVDEINNAIDDFSSALSSDQERPIPLETEKLSDLLDAARLLEGWAIAHRQDIQELSEILAKIEKTQNHKMGGRE